MSDDRDKYGSPGLPGGSASLGHGHLYSPAAPMVDRNQAANRYNRTMAAIEDGDASFWLKAAARELAKRDAVDAYFDARLLLQIAGDRLRANGHAVGE